MNFSGCTAWAGCCMRRPRARSPNFPRVRVYAPVGEHKDLLAYLVRRLLENGANTSFVNRFMDEQVPVAEIVRDPISELERLESYAHPRLPIPAALYADRRNSRGIDLGNPRELETCCARYRRAGAQREHVAGPIINGVLLPGSTHAVTNPADRRDAGRQRARCDAGRNRRWRSMPAPRRSPRGTLAAARRARIASTRRRICSRANRADFHRTPGARSGQDPARTPSPRCARRWISAATTRCGRASNSRRRTRLEGPTGELNELSLHGRGVFACISPWNFPLAIFAGQVTAALAAGNCRRREAGRADAADCRALRQAAARGRRRRRGAAPGARAGTRIRRDRVRASALAGVAMTGSTATALTINRALGGARRRDRAADRRNRRLECDDRRFDRAAGASGR